MFTLLWHCEEALYWQDTSALFIKTKITSLSQRAFYWRHCQSVWKRSLFFLQPVFGALPRWRGWWWYSGILCGHVVVKKRKNVLLIETFISLDIVLKVMLLWKDERSPSYFWVAKVPSAFTLTNTQKFIKKIFLKSHTQKRVRVLDIWRLQWTRCWQRKFCPKTFVFSNLWLKNQSIGWHCSLLVVQNWITSKGANPGWS